MQAKETVFLIGGVAAIGLAAAFAWIRGGPGIPVSPGDENVEPGENVAPAVVLDLSMLLQLDLLLAAEHVHSISGLLEIARQHQQPVPESALTSLELLSKHLGEMQRRVKAAGGGAAAQS